VGKHIPERVPVRAEQVDVAYRLLVAVGELWDGLVRAGLTRHRRASRLARIRAGTSDQRCQAPTRVVAESVRTSQHFRVLRRRLAGFESALSATVKHNRDDARRLGLLDVVDSTLMKACSHRAAAKVSAARATQRLQPAADKTPDLRGTMWRP
jgi:hypothetical protein